MAPYSQGLKDIAIYKIYLSSGFHNLELDLKTWDSSLVGFYTIQREENFPEMMSLVSMKSKNIESFSKFAKTELEL